MNYFSVAADTDASTYPAPHWKDANGDGNADDPTQGDHKYPVCYMRNTKMAATVTVTVGPPEYFTGAVKIRGDGPGNLVFPATDAALAGGEATTVTPIKCANPLPNCVTWYNPLDIKWEISRDGGATWIEVPPHSKNEAFITLDTPQCATPFRTVLYLATKNGGDSPETCLTNTWGMFSGRNVSAWNDATKKYDRALYYYNGDTANMSAADMLADQSANGQCEAWTDLLLQSWKANKIPGVLAVRVIRPNTNSIKRFVIKDLVFGEPSHPADAPWKYVWGDIDAGATGIPGQNTETPFHKNFEYHFMARRAGSYAYYDPSYGITVTGVTLEQAEENWRAVAVDAWGSHIVYPPDTRYSKRSDLPDDLPLLLDQ